MSPRYVILVFLLGTADGDAFDAILTSSPIIAVVSWLDLPLSQSKRGVFDIC